MKNSNRSWAWATMKAEVGADFTITPLSVSPRMDFWFPSGAFFFPQRAPAMLDYAPPNHHKASGREARRIRPERHSPHSIATLIIIVARYLVGLLPQCPCRRIAFRIVLGVHVSVNYAGCGT